MGVHYTSVVWDIVIQNPGRKLVALAIADMVGKEGTCYPTVRYLSEMCNMHPDTVREHLRRLEAIGLLKREPQIRAGRQTSNLYRMMPLEILMGRGDYSPQGGMTNDHRGGMTNHPTHKPSLGNHLLEPKGCGTSVQHSLSGGFSDRNRRPYPTSEEEMYRLLEEADIEPNPDRDGKFYDQMSAAGWRIRGKLIADWMAAYQARVEHNEQACKRK